MVLSKITITISFIVVISSTHNQVYNLIRLDKMEGVYSVISRYIGETLSKTSSNIYIIRVRAISH